MYDDYGKIQGRRVKIRRPSSNVITPHKRLEMREQARQEIYRNQMLNGYDDVGLGKLRIGKALKKITKPLNVIVKPINKLASKGPLKAVKNVIRKGVAFQAGIGTLGLVKPKALNIKSKGSKTAYRIGGTVGKIGAVVAGGAVAAGALTAGSAATGGGLQPPLEDGSYSSPPQDDPVTSADEDGGMNSTPPMDRPGDDTSSSGGILSSLVGGGSSAAKGIFGTLLAGNKSTIPTTKQAGMTGGSGLLPLLAIGAVGAGALYLMRR